MRKFNLSYRIKKKSGSNHSPTLRTTQKTTKTSPQRRVNLREKTSNETPRE